MTSAGLPFLPWRELHELTEAVIELVDAGWTDELGPPPEPIDPALSDWLRRAAVVVRDDPEHADNPLDEAHAETLERLARLLENPTAPGARKVPYTA